MPKYLLKPNPNSDFYLDWSTVSDDALAWGSREFMLEQGYEERRLEDCDERGTSAHWFRVDPEEGEVWVGCGWLPYSKMEEFFGTIAESYPDGEELPDSYTILEEHPELRDLLEEIDEE